MVRNDNGASVSEGSHHMLSHFPPCCSWLPLSSPDLKAPAAQEGSSSMTQSPPNVVCSSVRKQKAFGCSRLSLHGGSMSRSHRLLFSSSIQEIFVEYLQDPPRGKAQPRPAEATPVRRAGRCLRPTVRTGGLEQWFSKCGAWARRTSVHTSACKPLLLTYGVIML